MAVIIPSVEQVQDFQHAFAALPAMQRAGVMNALKAYPELVRGMRQRFAKKVKALRTGNRRAIAAILKEERAEVADFVKALKKRLA